MLERASNLARMMRAQWASPDRLRKTQDAALRAVVRRASRQVPFYRDLYERHGIDATTFRGLEDLSTLPIVDKGALRSAGERVLADDRPDDLVCIETSGSSGEPFSFPIDRRCDNWRKAQYLRPYLANGRRLTDVMFHLTAHPVDREPLHARLGLLRERQMNGAAEPARILAAWRESGASLLQGYPSTLRVLAHHILEGATLDPAPRRVFTDSELLTPDTRALIEEAFGVSPVDVFGSYETDNFAYQCAERGGYHVTQDSVVLEICRGSNVVASGEQGDLVVTVLHNHTHPFIRYRLGDIGRLADRFCRCGRSFPLLEVVKGRAGEMIVLPDGREQAALDTIGRLKPFASSIRQYQFHQLAADRFELRMIPAGDWSAVVAREICKTLAETLPHAVITLELVDSLPLAASGKLQPFVRHPQAISHANGTPDPS